MAREGNSGITVKTAFKKRLAKQAEKEEKTVPELVEKIFDEYMKELQEDLSDG